MSANNGAAPGLPLPIFLLAAVLLGGLRFSLGYPVSPLDLPTMFTLQAMYNSTLPELNTWNAALDCTKWPRVQCDSNRIAKLDFQGTGLGGPMPYFITRLSGLRLLYADSNNFLGSFPEELSKLTKLQLIRLSGNCLTGSLPDSFSVLKSLYKFHAESNCNISGSVPSSWKAFNLQEFYVDGNLLSGPVPTVICSWKGLQHLHMGGNQWTGTIPDCFNTSTQLVNVYFDNCGGLTGPLPASMANAKTLNNLFFNGNQLSGPIPPAFGYLPQLQTLFLSGNKITGPLPDTMGLLTALTAWVMEFNQIDGTIPTTIGNMSSIQRILLDNNKLTGPIPASIGNLKQLTILLLEGNSLTGRIPQSIPSGLPKLVQLNVESNLLTGVPPGGFISKSIWQVNYRSNLLSGRPNFTYSDGKPFCPAFWPNDWIHSSVRFNCFQKTAITGCKDNDGELASGQYVNWVCNQYCGANNSVGACNGHGFCNLGRMCTCDPGYSPSADGQTCLLQVAPAPASTATAAAPTAPLNIKSAVDPGFTVQEEGGDDFLAAFATTCSVGLPASCPNSLDCSGDGCTCSLGGTTSSPFCNYNSVCVDRTTCPKPAMCASGEDGTTHCKCSKGFRPLMSSAGNSTFEFCARTVCRNREPFVGFTCSRHGSA